MSEYQTVVVGTDGTSTSLRAVDRAGKIAAESNAKLIIAMGCKGAMAARRSSKILREARERAEAAGAKNIDELPIRGAAADALVNLTQEVEADLLVVGDVGLNPLILGRMFSVPGNVSRKAMTDVLVVHTTG
jgi:nucleotide-binding universal stress UspA family protein